jgi:hypothetical protein
MTMLSLNITNNSLTDHVTLWEKQSFPSATHFPECCTRGRIALGEEAFPECLQGHGTRGRPALGKGHLPRAQHSGKTGTRKRKAPFDGDNRRSRLKKFEKTLPRVPGPSTRGNIFVFLFFCPIFFVRPSNII